MITCINGLKKAWEIDFMGIYLATRCHVSVSEMLSYGHTELCEQSCH